MREQADIEGAMSLHGGAVWSACVAFFRGRDGAEDAFQDTFLRYAESDGARFGSEQHRRAWLVRVAINRCKDEAKRARWRDAELSDAVQDSVPSTDRSIEPGSDYLAAIRAVQDLPDPPKTAVYLSLCEQWTAPEIAEELGVPVNTVYSWIARGKKKLKEALS